MLNERENFYEVIKGGNPDHFVQQYAPFKMMRHPVLANRGQAKPGEMNKLNDWGVTVSWAPGQPGAFPVHKPETIVIKDFEQWKDFVKAPKTDYAAADWEPFIEQMEAIDRSQHFATIMLIPGIFEMCHYLGEISNVCAAFYEYPDELLDLIKYITEFELRIAEDVCHYLKPDAVFKHDDWGTQKSTFMSPDMFEEFLLPSYKELYGYYKSHGAEIVVHHSDSYAATLVPFMIDMGIDVWQGVMRSNDIPALIKEYGGKISFMGGVDSALIDYEGWTPEVIHDRVFETCDACGPKFFIPCASQGLNVSTFPGVYEETDKAIAEYSAQFFK